MSNVVEFSKDRGTNIEVTKFVQLIGESTVDIGNDKVILTPSKTLKDLYVGEYKILLKLRALKPLQGKSQPRPFIRSLRLCHLIRSLSALRGSGSVYPSLPDLLFRIQR